MVRRSLLSLTALLLVATACGQEAEQAQRRGGRPEVELDLRLAANLETFEGCDQLLGYLRDTTVEMGTEWGTRRAVDGGGDAVLLEDAVGAPAASAGAESGVSERLAAAPAGDDSADPYSGTNVQEEGVDEPDVVKTDGRMIVAVNGDQLHVVDPSGGGARLAGSLTLPESGGHEFFLSGDRVLVLTRSWEAVPLPAGAEPGIAEAPVADMMIVPGGGRTVVTAVDVSDPAAPKVVAGSSFEGEMVSARLHDGVVRLVLRSQPTVGVPQPAPGQNFEAAYEQAVRAAPLEDFLPEWEGQGGGEEPLVGCENVSRPPEPSGTSTLTVLTFDADGAVEPLDTTAVVADAQTVYASTERLYVATNEWVPPASPDVASDDYTTAIHAFDISDPGSTSYLGSGRVAGQLLNQWSLSDLDGRLRVATTEGSPWVEAGRRRSQSSVSVLERSGDRLEVVGTVGGLGPGETIHSVRFEGETGYVVTFRQTDPLYVLDLSDPQHPEVDGELKVTGFSSYLHPVLEDRLLGVGQAADEEGRTQGLQVSLFDVGDASAPKLVDREHLPGGYSPVEGDHRAFLWWADDHLAVVPASAYGAVGIAVPEEGGGSDAVEQAPESQVAEGFVGALVYDVTSGAVDEMGRVTHSAHVPGGGAGAGRDDPARTEPAYYGTPEITRSLVVGDSLYTVSFAGVQAVALDGLGETGWAGFPAG